jgi:GMP synthase (glutamine-hydrolysing)
MINNLEKILVLDFGGQYAHLIARRLRNLGYYSEIALPSIDENKIENTKGIILSGSPFSVYDKNAPEFNTKILNLKIPILGLCYGHQLLLQEYGGTVKKAKKGEFGFTILNKIKNSSLFKDIDFPTQVWMSHSDSVEKLPKGFDVIGSTDYCKNAATENTNLNRYTLQFHVEVKDTIAGNIFLKNFADICNFKPNWDETQLLNNIKSRIIEEVKDRNILVFLSGGVDSSVTFALLIEILGKKRVLGLYINNGFMRQNETNLILNRYNKLNYDNIIYENAEDTFLKAVKGIIDPQEKRRKIGETFLTVRDEVIKRLNLTEDQWLLAQGTLYPDIIESGGTKHSDTIKTHHNRVEGIKQLIEKGLIIEPLKDLYKDEVRLLGEKIGLSDEIIKRHPFPGPGISINVLCSNGRIDDQKLFDKINNEAKKINLKHLLCKYKYETFALPVKSVGVQGDFRTYKHPLVVKINDLLNNFVGWDILEELSTYTTSNNNNFNRVILQLFEKNKCSLFEAYCTKDRLDMVRIVDEIVLNEMKNTKNYNNIFQHLTINLPYASKPDSCSIVLRPVVSEDVMTARFARLDINLLKSIIEKIEKLDFVDGLYYDITNKPPATFGWE